MGEVRVSEVASQLPVRAEVTPQSVDELVQVVRSAYAQSEPVYPVGGGTSLGYGLPAVRPGTALHMSALNRVVDYPARDLTITVEAGITIARLRELLASEGQQLPIDVPHADRATLGGVLATNWNGPRRLGYGQLRDHVIGVRAVDGRGETFSGGGRVVKNVAGYDFCKLLTGSLGTLGVIYEVTLKLKPIPPASVLVVCAPDNHQHMARLLDDLALGPLPATSISWVAGPDWRSAAPWSDFSDPIAQETGWLAVGFDGTSAEVEWLTAELQRRWARNDMSRATAWTGQTLSDAWQTLTEFPDQAPAPIVLQAVGVPSGTGKLVAAMQAIDPACSILAHAGSGVVLARLSRVPASGLSRALTGELGMAAAAAQGYVQVISNPDRIEVTPRITWGGADLPRQLMLSIKRQFDPRFVLNPQRFVYHEPSPA